MKGNKKYHNLLQKLNVQLKNQPFEKNGHMKKI